MVENSKQPSRSSMSKNRNGPKTNGEPSHGDIMAQLATMMDAMITKEDVRNTVASAVDPIKKDVCSLQENSKMW